MNNKEFEITQETSSTEGINKYFVKGHINSISAPALQYEMDKALKSGQTNIVLNMTLVEFLSSAGIRVILKTYKDAEAAGGRLAIELPSENVINVLGMTALDQMLVK